jgi:RHS repeat-associated protein
LTNYNAGALTAGYRADGLRAWKSDGDLCTYYIYDGDQIIAEYQDAGDGATLHALTTWGAKGLVQRDLYAEGTPVAEVIYQFNPQGDVLHRLNGAGAITDTYQFDSWGRLLDHHDGDDDPAADPLALAEDDPYGFRGQYGYYTDAETNLILCMHRYYDPEAGRWLTRDPIGYEGGMNLYEYCGGEPVGRRDIFGLAYWFYVLSDAGGKHLRICLSNTDPVFVSWWGFYINEKRASGGGSSAGSSSGKGPGFVQVLDNPSLQQITDGRILARELSRSEYSEVMRSIEALSNTHPPYDVRNYNCATWAAQVIGTAKIASNDFADNVAPIITTPNQLVGELVSEPGYSELTGEEKNVVPR